MPKKWTQQIIIPKGTINSNEDTLIEIPREMQEQPIVVAKGQIYQENGASVQSTSRTLEYRDVPRTSKEDQTPPEMLFAPKHSSTFQEEQKSETRLPSFSKSGIRNSSISGTRPTEKELTEPISLNTIMLPIPAISESNDTTAKSVQPSTSKPSEISTLKMTETSGSSSREPLTSEERLSLSGSSKRRKDSGSGTSVRFASSSTIEPEPSASTRKGSRQNDTIFLHESSSKTLQSKINESSDDNLSGGRKSFTLSSDNNCCSENDNEQEKRKKLRKLYKVPSTPDMDDVYLEQLKKQFDEAKRKLEEAVVLASTSLKRLTSKTYSAVCDTKCSGLKMPTKVDSICDGVPERDLSFIPSSSASSKQSIPSTQFSGAKIISGQNEKELKAADSTQLPNMTSTPKIRTSISFKINKDNETQTSSSFSMRVSYESNMDLKGSRSGVSRKCSSGCTVRKSCSIKFVKEPCCTNSSCESFQKMSTSL